MYGYVCVPQDTMPFEGLDVVVNEEGRNEQRKQYTHSFTELTRRPFSAKHFDRSAERLVFIYEMRIEFQRFRNEVVVPFSWKYYTPTGAIRSNCIPH